MRIEIENGIKKLVPTNNDLWLIKKDDLEKPVEERYYFKFAFLPESVTLDDCINIYVETEKEEVQE